MSMIMMRSTEFSNAEAGLNRFVQEFLVGKSNLVGAEIGSFAGESAELFLKSNAFSRLFCIDPWEPDFDPDDPTTSNSVIEAEKAFDERFNNSNIVVKVKRRSTDALEMFADESLDFVYIDGNHQYDFVKWDIEHYFNKVKKGGIVAGHDYDVIGNISHIRGVRKAVDEFFKKSPIRLFSDMSWIYIKE